MSDEERAVLLAAIFRAARPGAKVICRTVEYRVIVDELEEGERFRLVEPHSTIASRSERSCLYRRVNCFEVVK